MLFIFVYLVSSYAKNGLRWAELAVFGTLLIVPYSLGAVTNDDPQFSVGVATPNIEILTYYIATMAVFLARRERNRGSIGAWWAFIMISYLGLMWVVEWRKSAFQIALFSGIISMLVSIACIYVGLEFGNRLRSQPREIKWFSGILVLAALVISISVTIQLPDAIRNSDVSRLSGIYWHPSIIGKVAMALLLVCLPMTASSQLVIRRRAYWTVGLLIYSTVPTLSRANIIALGLGLLIWTFLADTASTRNKARVAILVCILIFLPYMSSLVSRFQQDPDGGDRPALLQAGLDTLHRYWLVGTGPNTFVPTVASSEQIVFDTGYPVHNTFLLLVNESGIVGAILFFIPVFMLAVRSLRLLRCDSPLSRRTSASILALFPGLVVIGMVSWGLIQQPIIQLLCVCLGICGSWLSSSTAEKVNPIGQDSEQVRWPNLLNNS